MILRPLSILIVALVIVGCTARPLLQDAAGSSRSPNHYVVQHGGSTPNWTTFSPAGVGGLYIDVVVGPDKNLWFTDGNNERIDRVSMSGAVKVFAPGVIAGYITVGADKKFYFSDGSDALIGTMTTSGVTGSFSIPSGDAPSGLTLGPDHNVWFVEEFHVGKVTKTGVITEFALPTVRIGAGAITTGPDGNLWFTEHVPGKIGTVTTTGQVTEYQIPGSPPCSPNGIVAGPDRNLWFRCGTNIGRITTAGTITIVPTNTSGNNTVENMAVGPDGKPWFTDDSTGIHEIDPSTLTITDFIPPNTGYNNYTLVTGPDGNVWVGAYQDVINVYIPNPLSVSPKSVTFTGTGQMKTLTVAENGTGAWTAKSNNTAVATVAQGGKANQFVVTSVGVGKATITIADAVGNSFKVKIAVP